MARITPDEALQRSSTAQQQGMRRAKPVNQKITKFVRDIGGNVYLFRKGKGSLLLPADDGLTPILGESESVDMTLELPPSYEEWLETYCDEVQWWQQAERPARAPSKAKAKAVTRKTVNPLVKCKWGQYEPYNDKIIINGTKCVTGCIPTAVGQLLFYWGCQGMNGKKYYRGCMAVSSYTTDTLKVKIAALPALTVFDYKHLSDKPTTKIQKEAVATLMEYVGKACKADYGKSSTSAYLSKAYHVIIDHLRLSDKAGYEYAALVGEEKFEQKIYDSVAKGCPAIVCGRSDESSCHAFLVDGYDAATDMHHFNFGWYGSCDGYYKLSALPPNVGFNTNKTAITNVMPTYIWRDVDGNGEITINDVQQTVKHVLDGSFDKKADVNNDGKVDFNDAQIITNHILGKEEL